MFGGVICGRIGVEEPEWPALLMLEGMSDMELKLKGGDGRSGMNFFKLEMRAVGPLEALRLPSCPTACMCHVVIVGI